MSLSFPYRGWVAHMVKVYAERSHDPESRSSKSDETVAYVANIRLATAFELTTPRSKTDTVAHGLRSFPLRASFGVSVSCLASAEGMSVSSSYWVGSVRVSLEISSQW